CGLRRAAAPPGAGRAHRQVPVVARRDRGGGRHRRRVHEPEPHLVPAGGQRACRAVRATAPRAPLADHRRAGHVPRRGDRPRPRRPAGRRRCAGDLSRRASRHRARRQAAGARRSAPRRRTAPQRGRGGPDRRRERAAACAQPALRRAAGDRHEPAHPGTPSRRRPARGAPRRAAEELPRRQPRVSRALRAAPRRPRHLPPLGVVPDFSLLPRADDMALAAEVYRGVRTGLGFVDPERPPRSVVVTSSEPGEGKTATAVNLAIALAALDRRVIVVDAALRDAAVHRAFGLPPAPGLTDVVRGATSLAAAVRTIDPATGRAATTASSGVVHLLPAGTPVTDPSAILGSPRWHDVLRSLAERYETIIIDGPAVLTGVEATTLAATADAALLVVRGNRTERPVVRRALARLGAAHARVIGVALNGVDPGCSYYRSYAYPFAA